MAWQELSADVLRLVNAVMILSCGRKGRASNFLRKRYGPFFSVYEICKHKE